MTHVCGLFRYPVKSLRGHSLAHAQMDFTGIYRDRGWMVVDQNDLFLTQRQCAAMATIGAQFQGEGVILEHDEAGALAVAHPSTGQRRAIRIWNDAFDALDAGDEAAAWLSERLGVAARLVRYDTTMTRLCLKAYAKDSGAHTQFADGFPVLLTNQASLDDLNARMHTPLPMDRFRPNVVIDGLPAWEEDYVQSIRIGEVVLELVKPCIRCITTTTDQTTGNRAGDEPINTLARFRNNPDLGGVTFGWNAIVRSTGAVTVGDQAEVVTRF